MLKLLEETSEMYDSNNVKKIIITGGAGYIGNELIKSLPEGVEVVVIDNFTIDTECKSATNANLAASRKVTLIKANVSDVSAYKDSLKDADVVLYMASLNSYKESNANPVLYLTENNLNLQLFLSALKEHSPNVQKILVTSSRGVYGEGPYFCNDCQTRVYPDLAEQPLCTVCGSKNITPQNLVETDLPNPSSYYGLTKRIQEDLVKMYALHQNILCDVLRIFNVYGEDQGKYYSNIGIIPQIYEQIQSQHEIYLAGHGAIARDFVYVGDVVKVLNDSIFNKNKREHRTETYHVGSGLAVSIKDIADFFESLGLQFTRKDLELFGDIKYSVADNSKTRAAFGIEKFHNIYDFLKESYSHV